MTAYVIVEIEVKDPVRYADYKQMAPPSIALYGGRYLARGGRTETFEGGWAPERLVILEFPSLERAKEWLESPEYREARQLRNLTTHSRMVAIEGL